MTKLFAALAAALFICAFSGVPASACDPTDSIIAGVQTSPYYDQHRVLTPDKAKRAMEWLNSTPPPPPPGEFSSIVLLRMKTGEAILLLGHDDVSCVAATIPEVMVTDLLRAIDGGKI